MGKGASTPSPSPLGVLLSDPMTSLTNWTNVGTATFTADGTGTSVSGGSGFVNYRYYTPLLNTVENFKITMVFVVTNTAAGGIGIGSQADLTAPTLNRTFVGRWATNTTAGGATIHTCYEGTGVTFTQAATSGTTSNYAINDIIQLVFERAYNVYTVTATNLSNPSTQTTNYTAQNANTVAANSAGRFAIFAVGGGQRITSITIESNSYKNIRALFIGDSKTHRLSSTTKATRYADVVFAGSTKKFEVNAGANDRTAQYSPQQVHIDSYNADYVFLMIGGNDIRGGIASGTWQANLTTIRNNAKAAGASIVWLLYPKETVIDFTAFNQWIVDRVADTFIGDLVIDTSSIIVVGTDVAVDGVHPNDTGHAKIGAAIRTTMPTLY